MDQGIPSGSAATGGGCREQDLDRVDGLGRPRRGRAHGTGAPVVKGLTLTQPWASAIALGQKRIETRSWRTPYRGLVAIHAAQGFPRAAKEFALVAGFGPPESLPRAAVVAIAQLVDIRPTEELVGAIDRRERDLGDFAAGRWGWIFEDIRPMAVPVPCVGALGVWAIGDGLAEMLLARSCEAAS